MVAGSSRCRGESAGRSCVCEDRGACGPRTRPPATPPPSPARQFLAPEKLRGVGGILLNAQGRRFVDELTTRDKVAQVRRA